MSFTQTTVTGLTLDLSINGGIDIKLAQVSPVFVDCRFGPDVRPCVLATDGIEFSLQVIDLRVSLPAGFAITDMCDLKALEKQIKDEQAERRKANRMDAAYLRGLHAA